METVNRQQEQQALFAPNDRLTVLLLDAARGLVEAGNALFVTGRHDAAFVAFSKELAIRETLAAAHPDFSGRLNDLYNSYTRIGHLLNTDGLREAGAAAFENATKISNLLSDIDLLRTPNFTSVIRQRYRSLKFDQINEVNVVLSGLEYFDYTINEFPPSRPADTPPEGMREPETTEDEDELVTLARNVPSETRGAAIEFLKSLAAGEVTARATEPPRPVRLDDAAAETTTPQAPAPVVAAWPSEKWKGSPEELSRKRYAIIAFLRRVWQPFIKETGALVTRKVLAEKDNDAALALKGYLRAHDMPEDIHILSDRKLKQHIASRPVSLSALSHI